MRKAILIIMVFILLLSACAPMAEKVAPLVETVSETVQEALVPLTGGQGQEAPTPTKTLIPTLTPFPTATVTPPPTVTPTLLPPIELPTEMPFAPFRETWQSEPSLPNDIERDLNFTVLYDPDLWALTNDQFGFEVLAHRTIPYCQIEKARASGLSPGYTAEQGYKQVGGIYFQTVSVSLNGQLIYVNYYGGRGKEALTVFGVAFEEQPDICIADAEKVLSTLQFINITPTPEATLPPSPTP